MHQGGDVLLGEGHSLHVSRRSKIKVLELLTSHLAT